MCCFLFTWHVLDPWVTDSGTKPTGIKCQQPRVRQQVKGRATLSAWACGGVSEDVPLRLAAFAEFVVQLCVFRWPRARFYNRFPLESTQRRSWWGKVHFHDFWCPPRLMRKWEKSSVRSSRKHKGNLGRVRKAMNLNVTAVLCGEVSFGPVSSTGFLFQFLFSCYWLPK